MKNIFSSPQEADYQIFINKLDMILSELRHQRVENGEILTLLRYRHSYYQRVDPHPEPPEEELEA